MILEHLAARDGRLSSFLRRELALSYGLLKRLKYREAYRVNGCLAHTNHPVRAGDVITVRLDEAPPSIPAENGSLSILYEDDAVIALDKPPGLIIHPTFYREGGTLANRLAGYYQRTGQRSAVHLVSRLDRDTFGVVLIAKNAHMHAILCEQMRGGGIHKEYRAAVFGCPPCEEGLIDAPIARLSETSLLRCVREDGRPARSRYRVLCAAGECAALQLTPETGRTHQLRVHLAHAGYPILGDCQYGSEASQAFSLSQRILTQQLCAVSVTFSHPLTAKRLDIHTKMTMCLPSGQRVF